MAEDTFQIKDLKSGEVIFSEGDPGDSAYIVEISKSSGHGASLMLAAVKAGQMFGEMALIDASPRMATVVAVGKTRVIAIPKTTFAKLLGKTDVVIRTTLTTVMERLRNQTAQNIKKTL
ncbi:MAG: cyclic nucleotide-binding domain-containing protein [Rhodospirillaceae bacterium]